ncbi:MAG: Trk family potassium uptake protein [Clostridia bacterium]|nr:Trk family potassium uptake protein [Clostridia bacterium]
MNGKRRKTRLRLSSFQLIISGFLFVILLGAVLLALPISKQGGGRTGFMDALFTSVSAVCVTGLVVQDTATYWSGFGETVILTLIQIGGLGVVTVAASFSMLSGRKIGLAQRSLMQDAISAHQIGGIVRLTGFVLRTVFLIEGIGAALLAVPFMKEFGFAKGLWYAVFHSISAFCNAGFDLMGESGHYSSLTAWFSNPLVNVTVMALIIIGGLGFLTWDDVKEKRWRVKRYRLQSKIILAVSLILIVFPALIYFLIEFTAERWPEMSAGERWMAALFQAVTPRTAGFNSVDLTRLSESGLYLMIALMLVGGSPGSTAGGVKTTTVAVLVFLSISVFKREESARCFGRRIDSDVTSSAACIFLLYLSLVFVASVSISWIEGLPMLACLFESASAIATVGLSLGLTPNLSVASRIILMALMFFGRVGGLTLIYAASFERNTYSAALPKEKIAVG